MIVSWAATRVWVIFRRLHCVQIYYSMVATFTIGYCWQIDSHKIGSSKQEFNHWKCFAISGNDFCDSCPIRNAGNRPSNLTRITESIIAIILITFQKYQTGFSHRIAQVSELLCHFGRDLWSRSRTMWSRTSCSWTIMIWKNILSQIMLQEEQCGFQIWSWSTFDLEYPSRLLMVLDHVIVDHMI